MIRILAVSGSLRQASFNTAALRAAQALAPEGVHLDLHLPLDLPFYDEDLRARGEPEAVGRFCQAVREADGVLIATPEYNFSLPAVLKNALDWASRHPEPPFRGKPVAVIGASVGMLGSVRAQMHLREVLLCLEARVLGRPEVLIAVAPRKFDADGALTDVDARAVLAAMLAGLAGSIRPAAPDGAWPQLAPLQRSRAPRGSSLPG